jgi:proline racemase
MDEFRQLLLQEPRGYPCQNADVIYPSAIDGVDYGFVILEQNKVYPAMSGHNTICVATALLETGEAALTLHSTASLSGLQSSSLAM